MRLYLERPFSDAAADDFGATILPWPDRGEPAPSPFARRWTGNLLALIPESVRRFGTERILVNSGSLADDLGTLDPRNWMAGGEAALLAHLDRLDPALRADNLTLLLEPHSRHILNDAQVVHNFFRERSDSQISLAFNPTALYEPSMIDLAADHLARMAEALAPLASVLILADARLDANDERLVPCELNHGLFDIGSVLDACLPHLDPSVPIILRPAGSTPPADSLVESVASRLAAQGGV